MNKRYLPSQILAALLVNGLIASWFLGYAQIIWEADTYYISSLILVVGIGGYAYGFHKPATLYHCAEVCGSLGLIGTVLGMIIATDVMAETRNAMDALPGVAVALHTTFIGAPCALLLRIHSWFLGRRDV